MQYIYLHCCFSAMFQTVDTLVFILETNIPQFLMVFEGSHRIGSQGNTTFQSVGVLCLYMFGHVHSMFVKPLGRNKALTKIRVFIWVWFPFALIFSRLIPHPQMCRKKMRPILVLKHSKFLGFGSTVVAPLAVVMFFVESAFPKRKGWWFVSLACALGGFICASGDRKEVRMSSWNGSICRRYPKELEMFLVPNHWTGEIEEQQLVFFRFFGDKPCLRAVEGGVVKGIHQLNCVFVKLNMVPTSFSPTVPPQNRCLIT